MVNGMFWHRIGACGSTCECDSGIASLIKCWKVLEFLHNLWPLEYWNIS
jgi:hypothetical protein